MQEYYHLQLPTFITTATQTTHPPTWRAFRFWGRPPAYIVRWRLQSAYTNDKKQKAHSEEWAKCLFLWCR